MSQEHLQKLAYNGFALNNTSTSFSLALKGGSEEKDPYSLKRKQSMFNKKQSSSVKRDFQSYNR